MKNLLTFLFLFSGCFSFCQTSLQGRVTDAETGEPIIFGTVAIYENDVLQTGTDTDIDGYYFIEIKAGEYEVVFSYTGYNDLKIRRVEIMNDKANILDVKLSNKPVYIYPGPRDFYHTPVFSLDDTTQGYIFSAKEIRHMPHR